MTVELEYGLMLDMLKPIKGESLLDIGCGTGASAQPFIEMGLQVTGIDPSPYMLDIAFQDFGNKIELYRGFAEDLPFGDNSFKLYRGFAEDLPFGDNSFNHASIVTTLEFVEDPRKAIEEACRVAKDRIFIGVLNRYAIKCIELRLKGIFSRTIYNRARFYSVWELKHIMRSLLGPHNPVSWRTVSQFPETTGKMMVGLENSKIVQRFPFGAFAGIVATLVPRFRARPMTLRYTPKRTTEVVAG
ncbi:MAG: methyltransferase domain-containing protein [Deltaproteobacteria bacterium]